jgi:hypothetical protein
MQRINQETDRNLNKKTSFLDQSKGHICTVLPFNINEKMLQKPLRINGLAMTVGMSHNFNIYTPQELEAFANKLQNAPVYMEHVSADDSVGKVTKTSWDGQNLFYEAEIYDDEVSDKIRKGLIKHVSVGADYHSVDLVNGKVPHGLCNAEMSLVAVPGIAETNIHVVEKLHTFEQAFEPLISGEYILGYYQDMAEFIAEHYQLVWLDKDSGVLALMAKTKNQPEVSRTVALLFCKEKLWDQVKISDWLALHPNYVTPTQSTQAPNLSEKLLKKPSEPTITINQVTQLIEKVLPKPIIQKSWSLGPQRMCQELQAILFQLKNQSHGNDR